MKLPLAALLAVLLCLAIAPTSVEAQAPAPTAEQRTRAREAYTRGQQLFDAGQFEQAQAAFEEAYTHVANPVVLLGVASAQERRGLLAESRATLERYLRESPNARDRAQVEARIAALPAPAAGSATTTTPATTTAPATTTTAPTTTTTPATTSTTATTTTPVETTTEAGSDTTAGTTSEADTAAETDTTDAADTDTDTADAAATDAATDGASSETPAPTGPSTAVWVLTAVGAVGLVAGTVFGFMALSRQSDFDAAPSLTAADEGEAFALVADISFGVALAGGIAAIVLYATEGSSTPTESTSAGLRLVPAVGTQGGGLVALGRF